MGAQNTEPEVTTSNQNLDIQVWTEGPYPAPVIAESPFEWRIVLRWYGEPDQITPELTTAPSFANLAVHKTATHLRTCSDEQGRYTEKIFSYHLAAPTEGDYPIGAAAIFFIQPDGTQQVLKTSAATISAAPAPFAWGQLFTTILWHPLSIRIGIFLVLGWACVTLYRWKRSSSVETPNPEPTVHSLRDQQFELAQRCRMEGQYTEFIHALEKGLRLGLEGRFPEAATTLLIDYKEMLNAAEQDQLQLFIDMAAHIKFAPGTPSRDQLDQLWTLAQRLAQTK
ncbi:MAG: hypothetical protein RBU29_14660 [bacterium]|nr:hypothetical protein [bacterium]